MQQCKQRLNHLLDPGKDNDIAPLPAQRNCSYVKATNLYGTNRQMYGRTGNTHNAAA